MPGTVIGGLNARVTNIKKYGPNYYRELGRKGGKAPHKARGFQLQTREQRQEAGRKGGTISRRGKAKK